MGSIPNISSAFKAISVLDQKEKKVFNVKTYSGKLHMHEPDHGKQTMTNRDALDLLIPGMQGRARCRRWEALPLNTHTVASKSLLTVRCQLVRCL